MFGNKAVVGSYNDCIVAVNEGDEEGAEPSGEETISCNLQYVVKAYLLSFCTEDDYKIWYNEDLGIDIPVLRRET
jgi:hypothetical protein